LEVTQGRMFYTAVIEPARNVFLKHFDLDNACWLDRFDKWW
jgi:hypothetical protein